MVNLKTINKPTTFAEEDLLQPWFAALLANSPVAVFVFDTNGKLVDCNDMFVTLLSSSREQLIGLDMLNLPDQRVSDSIAKVLKGQMASLEIEYHSITSGKDVPISAVLCPVRASNRQVAGGLGIVEDLSGKREADSESAQQLAFEKLVAKISKRLVNTGPEQLDQAVELTLAEIGQFFEVDRCYIFQYDSGVRTISNTFEWCSDGTSAQIDNLQNISMSLFPWMEAQLEMQQVMHIPDVAKLDDNLAPERECLLEQDVKSVLMIPMVENAQAVGFLGIDVVRSHYYWPNEKIILLQVVAETVTNALSRRDYERALRKVNEQYRQFSSQVPLGLYTFRLKASGEPFFEYCNKQILQMNGVESADLILEFKHVHPEDLPELKERQAFAWRNHEAFVWEGRFILDGETRWMLIEDNDPEQDANGDWIWNGFQQDITDRKELEARLKDLATIDDMTQIWNRRYFMNAADEEFERAQRYDNSFSFLMVDADHFKKVNDDYGHAAGDAVLINLAKVMADSVRKVDFVGRLGGEEFAILLPNTPESEALLLAERIREAVEGNPADYNGQSLPITISIGVSSYRPNDQDLDQVIQRADKALYEAKNQGRNRTMVAP